MVAYAHIIGLATTRDYTELTEVAKALARHEVVTEEVNGYRCSISHAKEAARRNIHAAINDPYFIKRILGQASLVRKLSQRDYCERIIIGNLCVFTSEGEYVRFTQSPKPPIPG